MMRLLQLLSVVVVLLLSTVVHGQKKGQFLPNDPFSMPRLNYVIDADLLVEPPLITAILQLKYHNPAQVTLTEIWFQTGGSITPTDSTVFHSLPVTDVRCYVDSVSMHGVTIGGDSVLYDGNLLKVKMPSRILPGRSGYFQVAFKTRLPAPSGVESDQLFLPILNWYPKVIGYPDGPYLSDSTGTMYESKGEIAAVDVRVQVDTSLSLIFAAHLLNDKHHHGYLPRYHSGIVFEDIAGQHGRGIEGKEYRPVFDNAKKPFLLRATDVTGFPLILTGDLLRDRVKDDSLAVEVCYRPSDRDLWGHFVATVACELLKKLQARKGRFAPRYLTIVAGDSDFMGRISDRILVLPRTIDDPDLLYTALAFQLTEFWPHRLSTDPNSTMAFTLYEFVGELISGEFPDNRKEMVHRYIELRFKDDNTPRWR